MVAEEEDKHVISELDIDGAGCDDNKLPQGCETWHDTEVGKSARWAEQ